MNDNLKTFVFNDMKKNSDNAGKLPLIPHYSPGNFIGNGD